MTKGAESLPRAKISCKCGTLCSQMSSIVCKKSASLSNASASYLLATTPNTRQPSYGWNACICDSHACLDTFGRTATNKLGCKLLVRTGCGLILDRNSAHLLSNHYSSVLLIQYCISAPHNSSETIAQCETHAKRPSHPFPTE